MDGGCLFSILLYFLWVRKKSFWLGLRWVILEGAIAMSLSSYGVQKLTMGFVVHIILEIACLGQFRLFVYQMKIIDIFPHIRWNNEGVISRDLEFGLSGQLLQKYVMLCLSYLLLFRTILVAYLVVALFITWFWLWDHVTIEPN